MESTTPPPTVETSVLGRMFNVLAAPGEVYSEIKSREVNHWNWIVPGLVMMFCGVLSVFLLFSQDWAMYEIRRGQEKAMEQQVAKGKMTQAQADQSAEFMRKLGPMIFKIIGSVGVAIGAFVSPFFWGFIIWLVGVKFFKADFEFMKGVEAAGLAIIIYALSGLIGLLASFALSKITYVSGAFFVKEFDYASKAHFALAALNPFYIWFVGVIAVAVAILSNVSWAKAAAALFGFWILSRAILISVNMGQFTM